MTTTSFFGKPVIGNRYANPEGWLPSEWVEPDFGRQVKGEVNVIRPDSVSGDHRAGLWRTGVGVAGCEADGSCRFEFTAPDGDETIVVLEGTATVTVSATGDQYFLVAGSTLSHPKGLEVTWETAAPGFTSFWVHWNSALSTAKDDRLYVGHVDDDEDSWEPYQWEADGSHWNCGENYVLRSSGSSGSFRCGIWRSGPDLGGGASVDLEPPAVGAVCVGDRCAGHRISSSRGIGDESMLLLEGKAHIVNEDSGEEFDVAAGDIIAQYIGPRITWTSKTAHVKKFWIMTNAELPA
jgi:uncharacterized cupin superfamily protein